MSYQHDPLGHSEWRCFQDAREFQEAVRQVEEATGKPHPLSDTAQGGDRQPAKLPKLPAGHYASLDCVGTDGGKATVETVHRESKGGCRRCAGEGCPACRTKDGMRR